MKAKAIYALWWLSAKLPSPLVYGFATVLGKLLYGRSRASDTTIKNIRFAFPDMPADQQEAMARKSLVEAAKAGVEAGMVWLWPIEKVGRKILTVTGNEYIEEAIAARKGVVIIAPHLGNWEIVGVHIGQRYQTMCMYQPPKHALLDTLIYNARRRMGVELAPTNRKGVVALLKKLKNSGSIGILPDQVPDFSGGEYAPFYGKPALTMTLLSNLLQKTDAVAVGAYAKRRDDNSGFDIVYIPADENIYSEDLVTSVTGLNKTVEMCVNACPEQYQWEYKRYKRQPNGVDIYK